MISSFFIDGYSILITRLFCTCFNTLRVIKTKKTVTSVEKAAVVCLPLWDVPCFVKKDHGILRPSALISSWWFKLKVKRSGLEFHLWCYKGEHRGETEAGSHRPKRKEGLCFTGQCSLLGMAGVGSYNPAIQFHLTQSGSKVLFLIGS